MTHEQYLIESARTCVPAEPADNFVHGALGLTSEFGELIVALNANDVVNIDEEHGDMLWYEALIERTVPRTTACGLYVSNQVVPILLAELSNYAKRWKFYGKVPDPIDVYKILDGIALWRERQLFMTGHNNGDAHVDGFTRLAEIRTRNIAKLRARYPEKFTTEAALVRDLTAERKVLEG